MKQEVRLLAPLALLGGDGDTAAAQCSVDEHEEMACAEAEEHIAAAAAAATAAWWHGDSIEEMAYVEAAEGSLHVVPGRPEEGGEGGI